MNEKIDWRYGHIERVPVLYKFYMRNDDLYINLLKLHPTDNDLLNFHIYNFSNPEMYREDNLVMSASFIYYWFVNETADSFMVQKNGNIEELAEGTSLKHIKNVISDQITLENLCDTDFWNIILGGKQIEFVYHFDIDKEKDEKYLSNYFSKKVEIAYNTDMIKEIDNEN